MHTRSGAQANISTRTRSQLAISAGLVVLMTVLLACRMLSTPASTPTVSPSPTETITVTPSPTGPTTTATPRTITPTFTPTYDPNLPVWQRFSGPAVTPATPIPAPADPLDLPGDVHTLILMGTNLDSPHIGRTDAMMLAFYSPTTRRASLLSIPTDMFVYIPGYTMQRVQVAYAVGEIDGLRSTLLYNYGVRAEHWAVIHPSDYMSLVDEIGGLDIYVDKDYPGVCGDLTTGDYHMYGEQSMCYAMYRDQMNELDRNRRQQQVVEQILRFMVNGGNLVRLPDLYNAYSPYVQTSYTFQDLQDLVPLALNLGDPLQMGYFTLESGDLTVWTLPGEMNSQVFLPRPGSLRESAQRALDFVTQNRGSASIVKTLESYLTVSPTPTRTSTQTPTPTRTITLTRTTTLTRTITLTRTDTVTPTVTLGSDVVASDTPETPETPTPSPTTETPTPTLTTEAPPAP
jgi:LCP family protein required for cell wall assembly